MNVELQLIFKSSKSTNTEATDSQCNLSRHSLSQELIEVKSLHQDKLKVFF